jgi:flagellar motor switch protein FliG
MAETGIAPRAPRPAALLGGLEKAAILLLTLGPEAAAGVFHHLSDPEVRQLTAAMAQLRTIPRAQAATVHEEAWRWLTSREGFLVDGEQFARQLVAARAALGGGPEVGRLEALPSVADPAPESLAARLEPVAPEVMAQVLGAEHPQVIALVLANLPPKQAAALLARLPEDVAPDVVHRICDLTSVPEEVLGEVGAALARQVQGLGAAGQGPHTGNEKLVADIMNVADDTLETRVFSYLDEKAPEVAETIRTLMLTFEDLLRLTNRDLQTLLKEVSREDLLPSLKTASPAMREKIFSNVSRRAAEIMQDDLSQMGPIKLKDVEKAQANIVAVARRLGDEQKIVLGAGGGDEFV